ncbi:hypothetical protein [Spiroplasma endosymbiont of Virgichneumon dumeticola]|uniref:hypothetical protein n=1 Tax=Spiroplasma endosymbiont of Virgichneumon dumeticola TaxID=3139323 RepID=UPI0035C913E3
MKKFITSSLVLTTLLSTTPQITTLSKTNNIENLQYKEQHKSIDFDYVEKYFATKTEQEKQVLKENILGVISLANGAIVFDSAKLNKKIWDFKIYQIITSDEYLQVLHVYYQNKFLIFDEKGKASFNFATQAVKNLNIEGIWYETYWYWFSIAKLHFSSAIIEEFTEGGLSVAEIAAMISEACPPLSPAAFAIAAVITANAFILKAYDYGRGAWMELYLFTIPTLKFGSN